MSCCEGDVGIIYEGLLDFEKEETNLQTLPKIRTKIMINIASPEGAFHWWHFPVQGVGLARMEFLINNIIKIHPMALINFDSLKNAKTKSLIANLQSKET